MHSGEPTSPPVSTAAPSDLPDSIPLAVKEVTEDSKDVDTVMTSDEKGDETSGKQVEDVILAKEGEEAIRKGDIEDSDQVLESIQTPMEAGQKEEIDPSIEAPILESLQTEIVDVAAKEESGPTDVVVEANDDAGLAATLGTEDDMTEQASKAASVEDQMAEPKPLASSENAGLDEVVLGEQISEGLTSDPLPEQNEKEQDLAQSTILSPAQKTDLLPIDQSLIQTEEEAAIGVEGSSLDEKKEDDDVAVSGVPNLQEDGVVEEAVKADDMPEPFAVDESGLEGVEDGVNAANELNEPEKSTQALEVKETTEAAEDNSGLPLEQDGEEEKQKQKESEALATDPVDSSNVTGEALPSTKIAEEKITSTIPSLEGEDPTGVPNITPSQEVAPILSVTSSQLPEPSGLSTEKVVGTEAVEQPINLDILPVAQQSAPLPTNAESATADVTVDGSVPLPPSSVEEVVAKEDTIASTDTSKDVGTTTTADSSSQSQQTSDESKPTATPVSAAPSTDVKLAVTAAPLSPPSLAAAKTSTPLSTSVTDPEADKIAAKQVAMVPLVLKINKELIRLCVDLQGKDLGSDILFKDAALRLQSNLAFLASIADRSTKSATSTKDSPTTPINDEPFPPTLHAPDSMLPKLYALLKSHGDSGSQSKSSNGEANGGVKRTRIHSQESKRKKVKEQSNQQQSGSSSSTSGGGITGDTAMSSSSNLRQSQQMFPQQQDMQSTSIMPSASTTMTPPRQNSESNGFVATTAGGAASATPNVVNGMLSNPQQMQNLTQAFGQNAVMNLNALQAHYRGQPQAVVSYMEANISGFRNLPIQMQLQQMTSIQNAAMQRQRQQQTNPAQQGQQQQSHLRRSSVAQSPQADSPNARMANRSTQSPMPMGTASPGTPLQQQQGRPGTPASQNPFAHMGSPPASAASPAPQFMTSSASSGGGLSYSSPQNSVNPFGLAGAQAQSMSPMMANIPAHLQQQFLQQLQQQQQQQQQQSYSPANAFSSPPNHQANGGMWPPPPSS